MPTRIILTLEANYVSCNQSFFCYSQHHLIEISANTHELHQL